MTKANDVHILVTCNNIELEAYSFLVFDTLRIGFPTAKIYVYANNLGASQLKKLTEICNKGGYDLAEVSTIHHEWILTTMQSKKRPFWIVDTDIIFYSKVEEWSFVTGIAGYRIPEFHDPFTNCITRSRLHTSLMRIDPEMVYLETCDHLSKFNQTKFNPVVSLIDPACYAVDRIPYFSDTMSMAYHALGGTEFTAEQKDAYFHFHFGTLEDQVLPFFNDKDTVKMLRDSILKNPELGRGVWRHQDEYFVSRGPIKDGKDVIAKVKPDDSKTALEWNKMLCCGNEDAMRFCDLWYGYVHGIDDLIDTIVDNRPTMSKRQMIGLFFHAAILYNNNFYRANQALLFPMVLDITSSYTTSVEWEQSPQAHKRQIADLLRMAGNRMYTMVALICGGETHSQEMSQLIHERDWLGQHDERGNPI